MLEPTAMLLAHADSLPLDPFTEGTLGPNDPVRQAHCLPWRGWHGGREWSNGGRLTFSMPVQ